MSISITRWICKTSRSTVAFHESWGNWFLPFLSIKTTTYLETDLGNGVAMRPCSAAERAAWPTSLIHGAPGRAAVYFRAAMRRSSTADSGCWRWCGCHASELCGRGGNKQRRGGVEYNMFGEFISQCGKILIYLAVVFIPLLPDKIREPHNEWMMVTSEQWNA